MCCCAMIASAARFFLPYLRSHTPLFVSKLSFLLWRRAGCRRFGRGYGTRLLAHHFMDLACFEKHRGGRNASFGVTNFPRAFFSSAAKYALAETIEIFFVRHHVGCMEGIYAEARCELSGSFACLAPEEHTSARLHALTRWEAVCSTPAIPGAPRVRAPVWTTVGPAVIGIPYCHRSQACHRMLQRRRRPNESTASMRTRTPRKKARHQQNGTHGGIIIGGRNNVERNYVLLPGRRAPPLSAVALRRVFLRDADVLRCQHRMRRSENNAGRWDDVSVQLLSSAASKQRHDSKVRQSREASYTPRAGHISQHVKVSL